MGTGLVCTVLLQLNYAYKLLSWEQWEKMADECDIETICYWK